VVGVESLGSDGQQLAAAIQRIGFAAPATVGVLLDSTACAVHNPGSDSHDVERVRHRDGVGKVGGQRSSERFVQISDGDRHQLAPPLRLSIEPRGQLRALSAFDHVDDVAVVEIPDRRDPAGPLGCVRG